ncbi:5-formyltetrahydrofolate cyclo-ligase [Helicobacter sp. 16-1353]|uniref:5-formyltetrahydrofolate cyclo-ligase n=1 Tax=Helicobacter sp. 16-1353 TaxID=2004996 RepID=UPI000DCDF6EE|nr:5-formyltetrahydrofolate cyclo-ligase [Helicobacter sp. 16-1353]RAX54470.1 5-formyltetrahydrofolate cyclo-ligase [Helicobacter sp. 16-1353]
MKHLKKNFRKLAKERLFSLDKKKQIFSDKKICKIIENEIHKRNAKNILIYLPMKHEVDIFPLIKSLRKIKKINLFTPFIVNDTFKIVPFRLPLRKNKYNICESYNSTFINFNKIDLAIVPILGIDIYFGRVGFGRGMYDRFYANLKAKPFNIFVSRILNFANVRITDNYDIVGDMVIANYTRTRRGNYDFIDNSWVYTKWGIFRCFSISYNKKSLCIKAKYCNRTS